MHDMDPDIAQHWDLWSTQIGQATVPLLRDIQDRLPGLTSAMLCTADGFNLCSIGLDDAQVARLSARASSLYSVSGAASRVACAPDVDDTPLDLVSLHWGSQQSVIVSISDVVVGRVLLWLAAEGQTLGVILVAARSAAHSVRALLAADE